MAESLDNDLSVQRDNELLTNVAELMLKGDPEAQILLVRLAKLRHEDVFALLVQYYREPVKGQLGAIVRHTEDANDLSQEEALVATEHALDLEPDYAEGWQRKAQLLHLLERDEEAVAACDQALKFAPDESAIWQTKGQALAALGQYEAALELFDHALHLNRHDRDIWSDKARVLLTLERYKEALVVCDAALQSAPSVIEGWNLKVRMLIPCN